MSLLQSYSEGKLTTLNTLKYGEISETDGPLVKKTIPTSVGGSGPSTNEVSARADDLVRISKFLASGPGLKFVANQSALSALASPPNIKPGGSVVGNLLRRAVSGVIGGASTVGSILAQIPVNGTGTHFVQGFAEKKGRYLSNIPQAPHVLARSSGMIIPDTPADFVGSGQETQGGSYITSILKGAESSTSLRARTIPKLTPATPKKETNFKLGDPGKVTKTISTDYTSPLGQEDQVNKLAPTTGATSEDINDAIKLKFTIISSDGQPGSNIHLQFRAFLDTLADNFAGNWNSFNYVGRGEQFHTYNTFTRTVSIGFKIAAQTRSEMRPLYQKVTTLASATAPTYNAAGFMRGTLVKVTVGDYIYDLPGFLTSVSYNWQTDYPWEIAIDSAKDADQQQLPMVLNCQLNFTPIHTFIPQAGFYNYITSTTNSAKDFIGVENNLVPQRFDPKVATTTLPSTLAAAEANNPFGITSQALAKLQSPPPRG